MATQFIVEIPSFHWYSVYPMIINTVSLYYSASYSISEENTIINPKNVGVILIKSVDYVLEAVKEYKR